MSYSFLRKSSLVVVKTILFVKHLKKIPRNVLNKYSFIYIYKASSKLDYVTTIKEMLLIWSQLARVTRMIMTVTNYKNSITYTTNTYFPKYVYLQMLYCITLYRYCNAASKH